MKYLGVLWILAVGSLSAFQEDSTRLVLPWVSNNNVFASVVYINNPGPRQAAVTLTAFRAEDAPDNVIAEETRQTIPARGFLEMEAGALFPNLGSGSGYCVLVESTVEDLAGGWVTYNLTTATGKSPSQGDAVRLGETHEGLGTRMLFPYLPVTDGVISAPVIVNTDRQPTDVTLTFYTNDGTALPPVEITDLESLKPYARVATDLVGVQSGNVYAVAESSGALLTGGTFVFNQAGEPSIGNAVNPDFGPTPEGLLFPWISSNDLFETTLIAHNLGDEAVELTLDALRGDGTPATTGARVPAGGFLESGVADLFPQLQGGSGFSVRIGAAESTRLAGGWVTNNLSTGSGGSPSQGNAVPLTGFANGRVGSRLLFPFLPVQDGFTSAPVVVNTGNAAADVYLDFFDTAGNHLGNHVLEQVAPFTPFARVANDLVGDNGNSLLIASSRELLAGASFVFNTAREPSMGNAGRLETSLPPGSQLIDEVLVDGAGACIGGNGIELDIPAGAFSGETSVGLYSTTNTDLPDAAASWFIDGLPDDYGSELTLRLNNPGGGDPALAWGTETLAVTTGQVAVGYEMLLPTTGGDGSLVVALAPPSQLGRSKSKRDGGLDLSGIASLVPVRISNSDAGHFRISSPTTTGAAAVESLAAALEEAYDFFLDLGFDYSARTSWPMSVNVRTLAEGTFGLYTNSKLGDNHGFMEFNTRHMDEETTIRATAVHEFYHFVQSLYDSRWGFTRALSAGEHYWLDEAGGSWVEELFIEDRPYVPETFIGNHEEPFLGMHGLSSGARNHGYGMTALIKYVNDQFGTAINPSLYESIRDGRHPVPALIDVTGDRVDLSWWLGFFQQFLTDNIYHVGRAPFIGLKQGTFHVQDEDDTAAVFSTSLTHLGAALYLVLLDYDQLAEDAQLNFTASGPDSQVLVFRFRTGTDSMEFVAGPGAAVTVSNVRQLQAEGWHLAALLLNRNYASPYDGRNAVGLDIRFESDDFFQATVTLGTTTTTFDGKFVLAGLGSYGNEAGFPSILATESEDLSPVTFFDFSLVQVGFQKGLSAPATYDVARNLTDGQMFLAFSTPLIRDFGSDLPTAFVMTSGSVGLESYGEREGDVLRGSFQGTMEGRQLVMGDDGEVESVDITGFMTGNFSATMLPGGMTTALPTIDLVREQ